MRATTAAPAAYCSSKPMIWSGSARNWASRKYEWPGGVLVDLS